MRLVFLGSGAFGIPTLRALAAGHELAAIITQPDRPAGRGSKTTPTPVAQHAGLELPTIPVHKPDRVNDPAVIAQIRALGADAFVVIAYGQKLGRRLLDGVFAVNLHGSILPRWRGAAPVHHAILVGDAATGVSVITLADEMDAGDVLGSTSRPIGVTDTTGDLHDLLAQDGVAELLAVLDRHARGATVLAVQDPAAVTLAPKLSRGDAEVSFITDADAIRRRINAMSPWPGAAVYIGDQRLKLLRAAPGEGSGQPGALIDPDLGIVACGFGAVRLIEVQPEGGRPMLFAEYARGKRLRAGTPVEPVKPRP
jgi:methionyl-tRNA formyltransferase